MTAFRVRIAGTEVTVDRVTGLALAADPTRIEEVHDIVGPVGWIAPPAPVRLRLERAFDGSRAFYDWRRDAVLGHDAARRTVEMIDRRALAEGRAVGPRLAAEVLETLHGAAP